MSKNTFLFNLTTHYFKLRLRIWWKEVFVAKKNQISFGGNKKSYFPSKTFFENRISIWNDSIVIIFLSPPSTWSRSQNWKDSCVKIWLQMAILRNRWDWRLEIATRQMAKQKERERVKWWDEKDTEREKVRGIQHLLSCARVTSAWAWDCWLKRKKERRTKADKA